MTDWTQYPKDIELSTTIGPVWLAITDATHVHVDGNSNGKSLTVRGVEYSVSAHLYLQDDGTWGPHDRDSFHISRYHYTTYAKSFPSPSARKAIEAAIVPVVTEFMQTHPELLRQADDADRNNRISRCKRQIAEAEETLGKLYDELNTIQEGK